MPKRCPPGVICIENVTILFVFIIVGGVLLYLNMNSDKCSSLQESTADDMDVSDVDAAYDYDSVGPEQFDDSYSDESMSLDIDSIMKDTLEMSYQ